MRTCQLCGGTLTHRIEKGFIDEYDYEQENMIDNDSLRSDAIVDLLEYDHCPDCDTHFHEDLIIDGRNDFEYNVKLFNEKYNESTIIDPVNLLNLFLFIHMTFAQTMEFYKAIKEINKYRDYSNAINDLRNQTLLLEVLIENTDIINYEGNENTEKFLELLNDVIGSRYHAEGKRKRNKLSLAIFDIRDNNNLIITIEGDFFFDHFLYYDWKVTIDNKINKIKSKIKDLRSFNQKIL